MDSATAFAPASVSNVASGFDIMGFALDGPGDTVTVRLTRTPGITITKITGTTTALPFEPELNTAGAPVIALFRHAGTSFGAEIEIHKGLPLGSGIGSSAASAVAAAFAANAALGAGLEGEELLPFAIEGEKIASGAVHVDNLSPSLLGGFVLVRGYGPIDLVKIPPPQDLWCTIVRPHIEIRTKESRQALPKQVPLKDVVTQTGNAAGLIAGLLTSNYDLIGRSLHDVIAEPARGPMIPGFQAMKDAAMRAGALGCSISGSGPSVFALSRGKKTADETSLAMSKALDAIGCAHSRSVSLISPVGARLCGGGHA
jgi:homoserine kinase